MTWVGSKKEYYEYKKEIEGYGNDLIPDCITNYIQELEGKLLLEETDNYELATQNEEMLNILKDIYPAIRSLQDKCYWEPIKNTIEKVTHKSIDEVIDLERKGE